MSNKYDYIVIGDGVAARCVIWHLAQSIKFQDSKIIQISSEDFYPPCTKSTTSIVSLDVHESGISKLGDLLVLSTDYFSSFAKENTPDGVYKAAQYYLAPEVEDQKYENFKLRFGEISKFMDVACSSKDAFIIDSDPYNDWLKTSYIKMLKYFTFRNEVVSSININLKEAVLKSGEILIASKRIICCSGAYANLLNNNLRSKCVSGSYLEFLDITEFEESFILSSGHSNIIYRKHDQKILFGGSSFQGLCFLNDETALKNSYAQLKSIFAHISFPDLKKASFSTGLRHKGVKRLPHFEVNENIIWLDSLYKNGFVFSAYFAKKISSILDEI